MDEVVVADQAVACPEAPADSQDYGADGVSICPYPQHHKRPFAFVIANYLELSCKFSHICTVQSAIGVSRRPVWLLGADALCWHWNCLGRRVEDEMSYWLGPVFVKLMRLFMNLTISIHLFCCAYWRIKVLCSKTCVGWMRTLSQKIFSENGLKIITFSLGLSDSLLNQC